MEGELGWEAIKPQSRSNGKSNIGNKNKMKSPGQSARLANQRAAGAESNPNWFAGAFYVDFVSCFSSFLFLRISYSLAFFACVYALLISLCSNFFDGLSRSGTRPWERQRETEQATFSVCVCV